MKEKKTTKEETKKVLQGIQEVLLNLETAFTAKRRIDSTEIQLPEEDIQKFVETGDVLILATHLDGTVFYLSANLNELLGYNREEIYGNSYTMLVHPEDVEYVKNNIREMLKSGIWLKDMEYRVQCKDGDIKWHLSTSTPILNQEGRISCFITVARDITDLKMFDFNIREYVSVLERQVLQAKKMQTIADISEGMLHGIKNNLGPVIEGLLLISRQIKDENISNDMKILAQATEESYKLIMDLLSYARIETSDIKTLNVNELINSIILLLKNAYRRIEFRTEMAPDIFPIKGEELPLRQVLMDICLNAKDAIENKGLITISSQNISPPHKFYRSHQKYHGNLVEIRITDNGMGMETDICAKIFDPFFSTKYEKEGSGLGLAIAKSTIKRHGGVIEVESSPGEGSVFHIYLPAAEESEKNLQ